MPASPQFPRIKVLDIRDTHEIGGPGKTILETFRAIDSSRFELHLAAFLVRRQAPDTPFLRAARELGMPVHTIRGFSQYDPTLCWRLSQLVRSLGIHIVHAHEVQSDVISLLASRLHGVPTVTTAHGWIANRPKARLFVAVDKLVMRGLDRVIAVSGKIEGDLIAAGVRQDRVILLHNAIVLEKYVRTGDVGYLRTLLGVQPKGPVITSIGRLSREKGHADLLDALASVAAGGQRFTAVVAGDGPERASLAERARKLGLGETVHFPGHVSRPDRILEESDLMVLPSHTEGLPNAALEAMAMEVPVLATRVGGTPEVVLDGTTGRLVEPGVPSLAVGIKDFLSNRPMWSAMGRCGRTRVERMFDFRERTRKLEQIYAECAAGAAS